MNNHRRGQICNKRDYVRQCLYCEKIEVISSGMICRYGKNIIRSTKHILTRTDYKRKTLSDLLVSLAPCQQNFWSFIGGVIPRIIFFCFPTLVLQRCPRFFPIIKLPIRARTRIQNSIRLLPQINPQVANQVVLYELNNPIVSVDD